MKHTTQTATVKEMRTLANTAKKHSEDAANSWQQVHNLTAAAHSAANRACMDAIAAEKAARAARQAKRAIIIALLIATLINAALHFFTY